MNSPLREIFVIVLCAFASLTLTACGGGGGEEGGSPPIAAPGAFTMSAGSLEFNAKNSVDSQTQSVAVTVTGSGVTYLGAAYTNGQTQPSWLQLDITGSGTQFQMQVGVHPRGMQPGSYSTTFQVGTADSSGTVLSRQSFTVTLNVSQGVVIATASAAVNFTNTALQAQQYALSVSTRSDVQWVLESNVVWLRFSPTTIHTGSETVDVTIDASGLTAGTYTGVIRAVNFADGKDASTITFTVTVSTTPLKATAVAGNTYMLVGSSPRSFDVYITTPQLQQWTATSDATWLRVPSGTFTGSGSFEETIDATGLQPGTYTATVTVTRVADSSNSAALPVTLPFTLTVAPASLAVSESEFSFGGDDGRAALTPQPLHFSLSSGQYPYAITVTTDSGGNWLVVDHPQGSVGTGGASVNLSIDASQLHGGTYTGQVRVTATVNGSVYTETRPVTLNLEANRIVAGTSGIALSRIGGRSVLTRTIKVSSARGRTDIPWSATSDSSWLTVSSSGVTGGALVLTADPTNAPLDTTQFANVTITSSDPMVENQQTVRVGLFVSNTTPVDLDLNVSANALAASPVEPIIAIGSKSTDVGLYDVNSGALVRTLANVAAISGALTFSEDGRSLFVFDSSINRVAQVDVATGTQIANFSASNVGNGAAGNALIAMHPNGYPMLVTAGGRSYDLATGTQFTTTSFVPSLPILAFAKASDQPLLTMHNGETVEVLRSALRGGTFFLRSTILVSPLPGGDGEACFSASADRVYTARSVPYDYQARSLTTGEVIQTLPGINAPNSIQCVWNGLVIGGANAGYDPYDIFVYDGPSGTSLAQFSSNGSAAIVHRMLLARGLSVSADGTRLSSAWWTTVPLGGGVHITSLPAPLP